MNIRTATHSIQYYELIGILSRCISATSLDPLLEKGSILIPSVSSRLSILWALGGSGITTRYLGLLGIRSPVCL